MVKYVRLVGSDSDEIKNSLNPALRIEPGSKVALDNTSVEFNEALFAEYYTVGANSSTFNLIAENSTATVNLQYSGTGEDLTLSEFLNEIEKSCNYTPNGNQYLDYHAFRDGDYFSLRGIKTQWLKQNTTNSWATTEGNPNRSNGRVTGDATDPNGSVVVSKLTVPRVRSRASARADAAASTKEFLFGVVDSNDDSQTIIFGCAFLWNAGTAKTEFCPIENGIVQTPTATTVLNNYNFEVQHLGAGTWETKLLNANRNLIANSAYTANFDRDVTNKSLKWILKFPTGSDCQVGVDNTSDKTLKATVTSSYALSSLEDLGTDVFTSGISIPANSTLRKYLGFSDGTGSIRGDPAILRGSSVMDGDSTVPGIMVSLNNGILDSYDGEGRNLSSILAVINEFDKNKNSITYSSNFPKKIDFNVAYGQNMSEMFISFLNQADGERLKFSGKAVVTLLIYDAEESD